MSEFKNRDNAIKFLYYSNMNVKRYLYDVPDLIFLIKYVLYVRYSFVVILCDLSKQFLIELTCALAVVMFR